MLQKFNERNRDILVNISGKLIHRDVAGVSPFDAVVQGGDAVWEGLRVYEGRIFRLHEHLHRLFAGARALAFESIPSEEEIIAQVRATLEANAMRDNVHVRLTLTRGVKITSGMDPRLNQSGPTLIVLAEHKTPVYNDATDDGGLSLITSSVRRFPPDCLDPKIHSCNLLQSILAKIEANAAGADDAIMLDKRGFVAETNATHLFIVTGEILATSPTVACPEGVTRGAVLEWCAEHSIPVEVRDISLAEVYRAGEVFCTGTMGEIAWVGMVDSRRIGQGAIGRMTRDLCEILRAKTATQGVRIVA